MNILTELRRRFAAALAGLVEPADELLDMIRRSQDPKFGDYQANCAMPLSKRLDKPARDIAADIVSRLDVADLCEPPEIAGPGFINLRLNDHFIVQQLQAAVNDPRLGVPEASGDEKKTYVIDYSSPNVAKPMHVGHIRSTVIGDALSRTLRFLGHRVIGDNHVGDWGTQFGMIIFGYKHFLDEAAYQQDMVDELARLYRLVNQLVEYHEAKADLPEKKQELGRLGEALEQHTAATADASDKKAQKAAKKERRRLQDKLSELQEQVAILEKRIAVVESSPELRRLAEEHPDIGSRVLSETAKLHAGDAENRQLWEQFVPPCMQRLDEAYQRLGIQFDETLGESFYDDRLAGVVEDLLARGIATESDGAICVFRDGAAAGTDPPMLIRKKDGAFLYGTTDLATIQYRMRQWSPAAMLYVVDYRQGLHFEHLFDTARRWGYDNVDFQHISFGTVMGGDGKPYRTRAGDTVGLEGLLDEAVGRAYQVVCENSPDLAEDQHRQIAETVGIGALKYADLAHNRTSDYVFSYDKMLALNGNTATYMQYAYARVRSIFRKGDVDVEALRASGASLELHHPAERALGVEILRFVEALDEVAADYRPNLLTGYLFDQLAKRFSTFFESCPVLKADTDTARESRLLLCDLTARTLHKGLELLGIDVVEKM